MFPTLDHKEQRFLQPPKWGQGLWGLSQAQVHLVHGGRRSHASVLPRLRSSYPGWQPQLGVHPLSVYHEVIPLGGLGISWGAPGCRDWLPAPLSCLLLPLSSLGQMNSFLCFFFHCPPDLVSIAMLQTNPKLGASDSQLSMIMNSAG